MAAAEAVAAAVVNTVSSLAAVGSSTMNGLVHLWVQTDSAVVLHRPCDLLLILFDSFLFALYHFLSFYSVVSLVLVSRKFLLLPLLHHRHLQIPLHEKFQLLLVLCYYCYCCVLCYLCYFVSLGLILQQILFGMTLDVSFLISVLSLLLGGLV